MLYIKKNQIWLLAVNAIYLLLATIYYVSRENYEFIMYVGIVILLFFLILATNKRVNYPNIILIGLTMWGAMHMLGGVKIGDSVIYSKILINFIGEPYNILKYDQFVHLFGFGVATLAMFVLLKPFLEFPIKRWTSISILIIMAGFGVGALNEMIEFTATVLVPETGVGGFINTSLDLVADFIGAIFAMGYIWIKKGKI
ncbi:DUF2238 domain-containing protein [Candidatus Wolfebacteria bacterium]|nr:DUF2238 domain-containing protein [Candidatus Wolfebacteria bacterium]